MERNFTSTILASFLLGYLFFSVEPADAQYASRGASQVPVPGTGTKIDYVSDDFEDPEWKFVHNMPKSSSELNERTYGPMGYSVNRRWSEGPMRGNPDLVKVIDAPPGGLADSKRALQISTLRSGIPGINTRDLQQDDLIMNISTRMGSTVRAQELPNCVTRVYLPEASLWEDRSGPHFGIRLGVRTTAEKPREGFLAFGTEMRNEPYWPGIWIHFRSETSRGVEVDSAFLKIRGNYGGGDFASKKIPKEDFGWWTFGMSISADGRIHYFAKSGVEDLTMADHLSSQLPYGYRAERMSSFFFNICNRDDGRTWSTPFVIDDPALYVIQSARVQQLVDRKVAYAERRAQASASRKQASRKKR